jgi:hypothetical protein
VYGEDVKFNPQLANAVAAATKGIESDFSLY